MSDPTRRPPRQWHRAQFHAVAETWRRVSDHWRKATFEKPSAPDPEPPQE